jgi:hypothetical protein
MYAKAILVFVVFTCIVSLATVRLRPSQSRTRSSTVMSAQKLVSYYTFKLDTKRFN